MDRGTVIDLGTDRGEPAAGPGGPDRRRSGRALLAAATALAALLGPAGSAVRPAVLPEVGSVPRGGGASFSLLAGDLIVITPAPGGGCELTDHPLPGGPPRWRRTLAYLVDGVFTAGPATLLAIATGETNRSVTALAAGTGAVLWRQDGMDFADLPAGTATVLLTTDTSYPGPRRAVLVDLVDGRPRWSRPVPAGGYLLTGDPRPDPGPGPPAGTAPWLVIWAADGATTVVDELTGRPLASAALAVPPAPDTSLPHGTGLYPLPGALVLTRPAVNGSVVTAYEPGTLAPRWDLDLAGTVVAVTRCGALWCVNSTAGLWAVDPGTGRARWRSSRWTYGRPLGSWLVALDDPFQPSPVAALLDPGTGRLVSTVDNWSWLPEPDGTGPTVLLRSDPAGTGTLVAVLGPADPAVRVLRWLPGVAGSSCQATAAVLACTAGPATIRIWRVTTGR